MNRTDGLVARLSQPFTTAYSSEKEDIEDRWRLTLNQIKEACDLMTNKLQTFSKAGSEILEAVKMDGEPLDP